jgi:hypothetical protein
LGREIGGVGGVVVGAVAARVRGGVGIEGENLFVGEVESHGDSLVKFE